MNEQEMKAAVSTFRTMDYESLKKIMTFMAQTHASDHVTPTHTNKNDDRPKSFYMKRGMVSEQQGTKMGQVGWGGKMGEVRNLVQVPGVTPCTKDDEAKILYQALRSAQDYMVISADDDVGPKCLYITGIPSGYAGFSYPTERQAGFSTSGKSTALPMEVHYNVICIRVNGQNSKLLSTYPASQSYIDGQGQGYVG